MRRKDFLKTLLAIPAIGTVVTNLAKESYTFQSNKSVCGNWIRWRLSTNEPPPPQKTFNAIEGQLIPCDKNWFPLTGDDWYDKAKNMAVVRNGKLEKYKPKF